MADSANVRPWTGAGSKIIPEGSAIYELNGPMFFADADKLLDFSIDDGVKAIIVRMSKVPSVDISAIKNFEIMLNACKHRGIPLIFSHVNEEPLNVIKKAGLYEKIGAEFFRNNIDEALDFAAEICSAE